MALQKHVMEHVRIEAKEKAVAAYFQQAQAAMCSCRRRRRATDSFVARQRRYAKRQTAFCTDFGPRSDPGKLEEQELQIRAQAEQSDTQLEQAKLNLQAPTSVSGQIDSAAISQERQTQSRIDAAMQREFIKQRG